MCRSLSSLDERRPPPPANAADRCPARQGWCHQVLLVIKLKGLEDVLTVSHVGIKRVRDESGYKGYSIPDDPTGSGFTAAFDVYNSNREYGSTQMTIPILFDKKRSVVVSNDPAHMLLMFNYVFDKFAKHPKRDLYPKALRLEIERVNDIVFPGINDGVYRCWFARTTSVFDNQFKIVQDALNHVEARLETRNFLCGDVLTLADVRAFPHLFRYDIIYHTLCLRGRGVRVRELKRTSMWLERMYKVYNFEGCDDLQIATQFYLLGGKSNISAHDCDTKFYEAHKREWMPSISALRERRKKKGIDRPPYVYNE